MTPTVDTVLHGLYEPHEISPVHLSTRQDIVRYLEQERRNVVFVIRRTAARSRDDPLHKRLRYFLNIVSKTEIDFDLLEATAVLPTTLYTIFNYADPEGRFLPEEKYCAKLLYADYLSQGWQGRTKAFAWSKDEWYPFIKNKLAIPNAIKGRAKPDASKITRQRSDSGAAKRHARRKDSVKSVTFNDTTSVVEFDDNSPDVIQRASSLDTGRDRQAQSVEPLVPTEHMRRPGQRAPSPLLPPPSPRFVEVPLASPRFVDVPLASPRFLEVPEWKGSESTRRHRRDSAHAPHPHLPPSPRQDYPARGQSPNTERQPQDRAHSTTSDLPASPKLPSPPPDELREESSPRQVSIITPVATFPVEELKRKREVTLLENINRLRSQVESIDIQQLPRTPWLEHLRSTQHDPSSEQAPSTKETGTAEQPVVESELPLESPSTTTLADSTEPVEAVAKTDDAENSQELEHDGGSSEQDSSTETVDSIEQHSDTESAISTESDIITESDISTEQDISRERHDSMDHGAEPADQIKVEKAETTEEDAQPASQCDVKKIRRYATRGLPALGPVRMRICSIEQKARLQPQVCSPMHSPLWYSGGK